MQKNAYQFLIDCETTGLENNATLLSFAGFVLNDELEILETIDITIHYPPEFEPTTEGVDSNIDFDLIFENISKLLNMSEFAKKTHIESGLLKKVILSKIDLNQAKSTLLNLIEKYTFIFDGKIKKPILVNNSVRMDYCWLENAFGKEFVQAMDYRVIDISSINEMFKRYNPTAADEILAKKRWYHTSLEDAEDSLMELREYKKLMFNK